MKYLLKRKNILNPFRAKNFRMVDFEINMLDLLNLQERILKFNQSANHVKMCSWIFEKPVFTITGVDGVISVELNIDWMNIRFGLIFIKTITYKIM